MKITILVIIILLLLPFYLYILSKCITLGKMNILQKFFKKEKKPYEKESQ